MLTKFYSIIFQTIVHVQLYLGLQDNICHVLSVYFLLDKCELSHHQLGFYCCKNDDKKPCHVIVAPGERQYWVHLYRLGSVNNIGTIYHLSYMRHSLISQTFRHCFHSEIQRSSLISSLLASLKVMLQPKGQTEQGAPHIHIIIYNVVIYAVLSLFTYCNVLLKQKLTSHKNIGKK